MLKPTKGHAKKYNFRPGIAIDLNKSLPSPLKDSVI